MSLQDFLRRKISLERRSSNDLKPLCNFAKWWTSAAWAAICGLRRLMKMMLFLKTLRWRESALDERLNRAILRALRDGS